MQTQHSTNSIYRQPPDHPEYFLADAIKKCWEHIPPYWPIRNLIAVNPVSGFEDVNFSDALTKAKLYFQFEELPKEMEMVNIISIKWLQAYFDDGQATLKIPNKDSGLLRCIVPLLRFDKTACKERAQTELLEKIGSDPYKVIQYCLRQLKIPASTRTLFLTLMLTTLPGWASFVQYIATWSYKTDKKRMPVTHESYLALRLVITTLLWNKASDLITWHQKRSKSLTTDVTVDSIRTQEYFYRKEIIRSLSQNDVSQVAKECTPRAQFVFCIDVRSEPYRRAIEGTGNYETFGFAGFFGLPIHLQNNLREIDHASCPVLLKSKYTVSECPKSTLHIKLKKYYDKLYQSLKYTFTTPFPLAEVYGAFSSILMLSKTVRPLFNSRHRYNSKKNVHDILSDDISYAAIPIADQVKIAEGVLRTIDITDRFADIVVFCGHGSSTVNNAFASGLDCGACGGHHGASNAKALAGILNSELVRSELKKIGIEIPRTTFFIAALHNTTTDTVTLFDHLAPSHVRNTLEGIKVDLRIATQKNLVERSKKMSTADTKELSEHQVPNKAIDWAAVRPEWGLAKNAAFIVGPRALCKNVNLEGRSFLHSYNYEKDSGYSQLRTILTAPVIVAQWINAQYLFSTLDNAAFGAGSKITKNITGKIGIMQGNASDLMTGLPLQSVKSTDDTNYHQPLRLSVIVYAPNNCILEIIKDEPKLKQLVQNQWIYISSFDASTNTCHTLSEKLEWIEEHLQ